MTVADYTQLSGTPVTSASFVRWLDNGSDYLVVKVSATDTLYVKGAVSYDDDIMSYNGESWLVSTGSSYTYNDNDSGQITITDGAQVYSNLGGFRRLDVADVYPRYMFFGLFALILVILGFNMIRKRWIV